MTKNPGVSPMDDRFRFRIEAGERLTGLREAVNVSPQYLATRLGYKTPASIVNIEAGVSALPTWALETTCEVLGCTLEQLLGIDPRRARQLRRKTARMAVAK